MAKLPLSRIKDIVVQESGKEILIYNLKTHQAYMLNETSAIVYQACNGNTTFAEIKVKHKFTDDLIFLALDELKGRDLLEENQSYQTPFAGMSRREVIRKVGLASVITLPIIASIIAPTAVQAASCLAGQTSCPGNICRNLQTDTTNCGVCGNVCAGGQGCCGGSCTALTTNTNCGVCGNVCPAGASCSGGRCAVG